jgi:uncharacterized protein YgiM (DUF1202 family)
MKLSHSLILVLLVCFVILVSYNVVTTSNYLNGEFINKNRVPLTIEIASRLRLVQSLGNVLTSNNSSSGIYAYVKPDALNVRSGPSADYGVIARLSKNSKVEIINKSGTWWKIKNGNWEGYVNSQFLVDSAYLSNAHNVLENIEKRTDAIVEKTKKALQDDPYAGTTRSRSYIENSARAEEEYARKHGGSDHPFLDIEALRSAWGSHPDK